MEFNKFEDSSYNIIGSKLKLIREKLTDNKLPFSYHENSYLELRNYLNKRCNLKYQRYLEEYQNLPNNKRILLDKLKEILGLN